MTFRPEAAYEFVIGGASAQQNRCIGVLFSEPASDGSQTLRVLTGTDDEDRGLGTEIGRGMTGETSQLHLAPWLSVGWLGPARSWLAVSTRAGSVRLADVVSSAQRRAERLQASWAFSSSVAHDPTHHNRGA